MRTSHCVMLSLLALPMFRSPMGWIASKPASTHLWIVDGNGGGDFLEIADAVDAAEDGDTILVRPLLVEDMAYAPFTIDDKDLRVIGEKDSFPFVEGAVVKNLSDWKQVVISRLAFRGPDYYTEAVGLLIDSCEGSVRIFYCTSKESHELVKGLLVQDSLDVVVDGFGASAYNAELGMTDIRNSRVATFYLASSTYQGQGAEHYHGAAGLRVEGSEVWVDGGALFGGDGGDSCPYGCYAKGGPGIRVVGGGSAHVSQDSALVGGFGGFGGYSFLGCVSLCGPDGDPYEVEDGSSLDICAESLPRLVAKPVVESGDMYDLAIHGVPGSRVVLRRSSRTDFQVLSQSEGVDFIGSTIGFNGIDLGVVPESGNLRTSLPVSKLMAYTGVGKPWLGDLARTLYLQPQAVLEDGSVVYGNLLAVTIVAGGIIESFPYPERLFVDVDAQPGGDGLTWDTAFQSFAELNDYLYNRWQVYPDRTTEVWVAEGTYRGEEGGATALAWVPQGVELLGGFEGGETDEKQRNPRSHIVILSGDVNGDDTSWGGSTEDNTHTGVYLGSYNDFTVYQSPLRRRVAVLDGVTIEGFTVDGIAAGNALVRNCRIRNCARGCELTRSLLVNCEISHCGLGEEVFDGAARISESLWPLAGYSWWSLYDRMLVLQNPELMRKGFVNCKFTDNHSSLDGAITVRTKLPPGDEHILEFVNCEFNQNRGDRGGAILVKDGAVGAYRMRIENCTFYGNHASNESGGGAGGFYDENTQSETTQGHVEISNSIFWANQAGDDQTEFAQIGGDHWDPIIFQLTANCIMGYATMTGDGNIPNDPRFWDPLGPDGLPGTGDEDFTLEMASPCVDAGWNMFLPFDWMDLDADGDRFEPLPVDLNNRARQADGERKDTGMGDAPIVDMGAYERRPAGLAGH